LIAITLAGNYATWYTREMQTLPLSLLRYSQSMHRVSPSDNIITRHSEQLKF